MSTTSELIDAYTKAFDSDYFKNMQGIQAGLEAMYKSITGNDAYKQIQAWQKVLNDPESSINKSMRMWSEFSKKIDYEKLQECCLTQGLMGIMPLPYSLIYEGMATAMYEQLKDLRFNMAYVRGAIGRIELVESGAYHFAIGSQFAVEHEIQCGREIEAVFNFGVGSYLSKHVLLLRDHGKNGITEGMRVAYDSESLDQSCLTTNIVKGKKVELVNMRTQQTITALLDGNIDAGVWNYDDVLENHCLDDLKVVFLTESEYNEKFSTAVMVIRKNNKYLKKILEKNISVSKTLEILSDVCKGKKHPYY